ELVAPHTQKADQPVDVAVDQASRRRTATVSACAAIDGVRGFFGDALQAALHKVVALQVVSEPLVLVELLLSQTADLDEIGDHKSCSLQRSGFSFRTGR